MSDFDAIREYLREEIARCEDSIGAAALEATRALQWFPRHDEREFQMKRRITEKWFAATSSYRAVLAAVDQMEQEAGAARERRRREYEADTPEREAKRAAAEKLSRLRSLLFDGSEAAMNCGFFVEQDNMAAAREYMPLLREVLAEQLRGVQEDNDKTVTKLENLQRRIRTLIEGTPALQSMKAG